MPGDLKVATQANKNLPAPEASRVIRIEVNVARIAELMLDRLDQMLAGEMLRPAVLAIAPRLMKADRAGVKGAKGKLK